MHEDGWRGRSWREVGLKVRHRGGREGGREGERERERDQSGEKAKKMEDFPFNRESRLNHTPQPT